jgi:nitroimidazol reductase NimA-like FMN-containing flavoprotein (pyridoxamine 5'-phosphate oxidase superfamily)
MDPDARFAYTRAMTEREAESKLASATNGTLALADGDESYAIPLYHHYDDGSLFFRLGETPDNSKAEFIETTDTATYVVYWAEQAADAAEERGWSIVARGPIERVPTDHPAYDVRTINEWFAPIRLFDEAHDEVELTLYELRVRELSGRQN